MIDGTAPRFSGGLKHFLSTVGVPSVIEKG
jgi:hypothetical protein